jgi:Bacterial regulatory helix-turn-helix protein, lysR family
MQRLVRYFTVVADHRHFGRAAAALRVAQPSLSRQIRHLEQQLGARLLDRTPQGSQLTEAGAVFLPRARALLRSAAQAAAQAVAIVSAGLRAGRRRPDLTTIPLDGVEPSHVVLATRAGDRSRLVAAFRKCAQACLTGPGPAGPVAR